VQHQQCGRRALGTWKLCLGFLTFFKDSYSVGVDIVIRGSHDKFLKAKTNTLNENPITGRSRSSLPGHHRMDNNTWFEQVLFEPGNKTIANSLNNNATGFSDLCVILAKCRANILSFSKSKVSFTRKQADHVAHFLVKAQNFMIVTKSLTILTA